MNPFRRAVQLAHQRKNVSAAVLLPSYNDKRPQDKDWDPTKAIKEGYRASATVFACIDRRSKAIAALPWYVEQAQSDGEWERVPGHPVEDLLEHPNPAMGRNGLFTRLVQHLDIDGNGLWTKVKVGGQVKELWPVQTRPLRVIPSRADFISGYEYMDGDVSYVLKAEDVIHFMCQDPGNQYWGMPPMRAVSTVIDTVVQAISWNKSIFSNRALPDLLFTVNQSLNMEDVEGAQDEIEHMYAGARNARKPLVVGNGTTAEVINWKPADLDYIPGLHYYRQEIAKVYGVPLSVLGILEDAPNATLQDSRKIFWEDTVLPFADTIKSALNLGLASELGDGFRVCYDASGIPALREDMTAKTTQLKDMVASGVPLNAALKRLELDIEDVEGGDVGNVPSTMIPLTDVGTLANDPPSPPRLGAA